MKHKIAKGNASQMSEMLELARDPDAEDAYYVPSIFYSVWDHSENVFNKCLPHPFFDTQHMNKERIGPGPVIFIRWRQPAAAYISSRGPHNAPLLRNIRPMRHSRIPPYTPAPLPQWQTQVRPESSCTIVCNQTEPNPWAWGMRAPRPHLKMQVCMRRMRSGG